MRVVNKINVYSKLNSPSWPALNNLKDNARAFISRWQKILMMKEAAENLLLIKNQTGWNSNVPGRKQYHLGNGGGHYYLFGSFYYRKGLKENQ